MIIAVFTEFAFIGDMMTDTPLFSPDNFEEPKTKDLNGFTPIEAILHRCQDGTDNGLPFGMFGSVAEAEKLGEHFTELCDGE